MITQGLITEAQNLLPYRHLTPLQTVGYTELFDFFDKKTTQTQATEYIKQHTRNYAKRQLTWFNKNKKIHWYAPHNTQNIIDKIDELLNN
jgi:tRNA dimethylallyltransferase